MLFSYAFIYLRFKGECPKRDCPYRHIKPEDERKECQWYKRGLCRHGLNF